MSINFLGQNYYTKGTSAKKPNVKLVSNNKKAKAPQRNFKVYDLKQDYNYKPNYNSYAYNDSDIEFIDIDDIDYPTYKKPVKKETHIEHTKPRRKASAIQKKRKAQKNALKASISLAALLSASAAALYSTNVPNQNEYVLPIESEQFNQDFYVPFEAIEEIEEMKTVPQEPEQDIQQQDPLEQLYNGAFNFTLTPTEDNIKGLEKFMKIWNNPQNRQRYEYIAEKLGIPPEIVAINHYREATGDFSCSQVDGHPLEEGGFESWEESALYAYENRGIDLSIIDKNDINTWFEFLEDYNGNGYQKAGINTPYVWSGTSLYTSGKYTSNGKYNPNVVDSQAGAALILRELFLGDVLIGNNFAY